MLWNHTLRLIFKLLIWPIVRDENLICLFKRRVETVFTPNYAFIYLCIHSWRAFSKLVISSNIHYLDPYIFVIWITRHFKNRFLIMMYFPLKLFLQLLGNVNLCWNIYLRLSRWFTVFQVCCASSGWAIFSNNFLRIINHWNLT